MALLQGNTYLLPIRIEDCEGDIVRDEQVERGEFVVGEITKFYGVDGEVVWSEEQQAFIMPLTEQETFGFKKGAIKYQGRVYLKDGSVSGSVPTSEYVYESIGTTILSNGGVGEDSGKVLTIRLLDRVINTGITEEVDPTVPQHVKEITEQDIENWNKVNKLGNVFKYKGSVQTYADLPTENNQVGDVWNVVEKYESYPAGTNFAWTPDGTWDALGGTTEVVETLAEAIRDNTTQIVPTSGGLKIGGASTATLNSIAIGRDAKVSQTNNAGIAIGRKSNASALLGDNIAIGDRAIASGRNSIQLLSGTNNEKNSLQIKDDNIYKTDTHTLTVQNAEINGTKTYGVLQGEADPTNATVGAVSQFYLNTTDKKLWQCVATTTDESTSATSYEWQPVGGGLPDNIKVNGDLEAIALGTGGIAIGSGASSEEGYYKDGGIAIGSGAKSGWHSVVIGNKGKGNGYGVAIGYEADGGGVSIGYKAKETGQNAFGCPGIAIGTEATSTSNYSVAIGYRAKANINKSIQIGEGTNSQEKTFQIYDDNIYKANTHTLTVQNIELNGVDLGNQLGDLNTALETILGV